RGSSWGSLDAWIIHDRLVELHHDRVDQCQDPAVVLPRIVTRRGVRQARGYRPVERHVVFLERVHCEVVSHWETSSSPKPIQLFASGKLDGFLGFPPEPQDLRAPAG